MVFADARRLCRLLAAEPPRQPAGGGGGGEHWQPPAFVTPSLDGTLWCGIPPVPSCICIRRGVQIDACRPPLSTDVDVAAAAIPIIPVSSG